MKIKSFLAASLMFLLAACGPPQPYYQTTYELVAPPTDNGRMCANNCLLMKQNCSNSCNTQAQQCQQLDSIEQTSIGVEAQREYDEYVRECKRNGQAIMKTPLDFEHHINNNCSASSCLNQCMNDYYICHTNCGGQVIPHTNCVANCNMIGAGQVPQP